MSGHDAEFLETVLDDLIARGNNTETIPRRPGGEEVRVTF
jgi:hypothetical protein